jgi:hypothetical protein
MAWQRFKVEIPEGFTPSEREAIAERIIERIRERSAEGTGIRSNGRHFTFPGYSDAYINSDAFKKAGKSPGQVNLKLSGEMLEELSLISNKPTQLLIGFQNGTESNAKAEGNAKKRNFLGLNKSELAEILSEFEE